MVSPLTCKDDVSQHEERKRINQTTEYCEHHHETKVQHSEMLNTNEKQINLSRQQALPWFTKGLIFKLWRETKLSWGSSDVLQGDGLGLRNVKLGRWKLHSRGSLNDFTFRLMRVLPRIQLPYDLLVHCLLLINNRGLDGK